MLLPENLRKENIKGTVTCEGRGSFFRYGIKG